MTDDNAIDSGGVYAYMAPDVTPVQPQPLPIPSVPLTFAISAVDIMEAIRGLGLRIDALVKRCDELEKHTEGQTRDLGERVYGVDLRLNHRCDDMSVRLDALEAAREPESRDCVVQYGDGSLSHRLPESVAKSWASEMPGRAVMRLVPVEPAR